MDLSSDDPLADILSNDSSDSFFNNEPKAKFKKPGMSAEKFDSSAGVKDSTVRIEPSIPQFSHTKSISKTVTSSFDVSNLPVAPTDLPKPSRNAGLDSTSNFFDDLLAPIDSKRNTQTPGRSNPKSKMIEMKTPVHQSIETMEDNITGGSTLSIGLTGSRDRNRNSTNTKDVKDPKGLSNPSKKILNADWLIFDDNKDQHKNVPRNLKSPEKTSAEKDSNSMLGNIKSSEVEAQHMLQTLNQQESHVILAGHMRKQEQTLLEMQNKQKELLDQQEYQFNKLVEKQITRHNQLEQTIRTQQERINSYLHLLMAEPLTYLPQTSKEDVKLADTKTSSCEESGILARSKSQEAEEDKLRMEHFLSSVIKNHEKEIQLLEDSHKKQINMLEVHIQHLEDRLNNDMKDMEVMYIKKIDFLNTENEKNVTSYEKKLSDMEQIHEEALKKVRNEYRCQMEDLKEDHKTIVDNMRNSRLSELSVLQETPSHLETLKGALNNLESATGDIKVLRDDIHTKINEVYNQREINLTAREKKVEDMEHHLKLQHETYEIEQKRLMEIVSSLEVQLSTLNKEKSEEQRILRQKLSSLEAERDSFEQDKRNVREQLERREKHVEDLRKFNLEEYNHHMQRVNEERQMVVAERKKLEIENTLNKSSNQEAMQAEFQMALKIADDAKKQAETEHQKYLNMQRVLEIEKRKLSEKETSFQKKQDELEFSIASLKAKESYTQELYSKCQVFEQNMNVKIAILEEQMRRIMEREARVSKDRLQVAQERMELQKLKEKISETKCSLCKLTTEKNNLDQIPTQMLHSPQDRAAIHASLIKIPVTEDDQFCLDSGFEFEVLQSLKRMQDTCRSGTMTVDLDAAEKCKSFKTSNRGEMCRILGTSITSAAPGIPTHIRLPHTNADVFRQFILYVYTSRITLHDSKVFKIMTLAHEMGVDGLQNACEEHLVSTLSVLNACTCLTALMEIVEKNSGARYVASIMEKCINFIGENAAECVRTPSFLNLNKEALIKLISSDYFCLEEEDVWRCVLSWAKHQAGVTQPTAHWTEEERIRVCQHLQAVIGHVRLLLIDSKVFAEEVEPTGAVPMELSLERYKHAALHSSKSVGVLPTYGSLSENSKRFQPRLLMNMFPGSNILKNDKIQYQGALNGWFGVPKQMWKLVFRGSTHGFEAAAFHRHCDGIAPIFVIAIGYRGEIGGGFTDVAWAKTSRKGGYIHSERAFLFSFNSSCENPVKFDIIKKPYAICYHPECGPIFGAGADLFISSGCNTNTVSYSNLPHSYDGPNASYMSLFGDYHFMIADYEIFTVSAMNE